MPELSDTLHKVIVLLCVADKLTDNDNFIQRIFVCQMICNMIKYFTERSTVFRTTLWRWEQKQKRQQKVATTETDGLDDPLPPPAKRKHRKHKLHKCQYCHQALSYKC